MKRELKFRSWDSNTRSMSPIATLKELFCSPDHTSVEDETFFQECLTFMQYTGVKDSKGVDIYERDLLFAYDLVWEVAWFRGGFVAIRPGKIRSIGNIYCEVIGNKFQNPKFTSTAYYLTQRKI